MPSIRPGFYIDSHLFNMAELINIAELKGEYDSIFHTASVGNNLSVWFTNGNIIKAVDFYGRDLTEKAGISDDWRIFHATYTSDNVTVYFADTTNQIDDDKEQAE